jgi:glycosyltransferase involved in cell wall biosynthesis
MANVPAKVNVLHFAKIVSRNDFVDSIVSNLDPLLFNVYVVTFEDISITFTPVYKEKRIKHYNLNEKNARNFLKLVPAISKIIRQHNISIVHAHLFEEQFIAAFLKLRHPKVKFVIGRHYSDEIYLLHSGIKRKVWVGLENFSNRMATVIIAGSQMVKDILIKQGVPSQKIASLPYGFNFDDYRYEKNTPEQTIAIRHRYGIEPNDVMFVNVGRLFKLKGQDLLIRVFASIYKKHSNIKLLIIGDGDQRQQLEQLVSHLNLEKVVFFTGWLKDAHTYISAADVVVHPTLSEMFSQLMIESMAQGKPLIINNVSAVPDVITNGVSGIICEHNFTDWEHALLLVMDEKLRKKIGHQAEQHVKQTYPIEVIIKDYEQLYLDLIKK